MCAQYIDYVLYVYKFIAVTTAKSSWQGNLAMSDAQTHTQPRAIWMYRWMTIKICIPCMDVKQWMESVDKIYTNKYERQHQNNVEKCSKKKTICKHTHWRKQNYRITTTTLETRANQTNPEIKKIELNVESNRKEWNRIERLFRFGINNYFIHCCCCCCWLSYLLFSLNDVMHQYMQSTICMQMYYIIFTNIPRRIQTKTHLHKYIHRRR